MAPAGKHIIGVLGSSSLVSEGLRAMLLELTDLVEEVIAPESKEDCDRCAVLFMERSLWREVQPDTRVVVVCSADVPDIDVLQPPFPHGYLFPAFLTAESLRRQINDCLADFFSLPLALLRSMPVSSTEDIRGMGMLTARERQALALSAHGFSNSQVAFRLRISENSVKRLMALTMGKLGAPNRTAAVVTAIRMGILPCPASGGCSNESWASFGVEPHLTLQNR